MTHDVRRTTPWVWHKLPTGELKIQVCHKGYHHFPNFLPLVNLKCLSVPFESKLFLNLFKATAEEKLHSGLKNQASQKYA